MSKKRPKYKYLELYTESYWQFETRETAHRFEFITAKANRNKKNSTLHSLENVPKELLECEDLPINSGYFRALDDDENSKMAKALAEVIDYIHTIDHYSDVSGEINDYI